MRRKKLFLRGDFRQFSNENVHIWDHFFQLLFPKDFESLKILDIRLREVGAKRQLKKTENRRRPKKSEEKNFFLRGDFRQFSNKNAHIWDHFFPLLFPKNSESLKILDMRLREVGAKRQFKKTKNRRRPKKFKKKTFFCAAILDNFWNKNVYIWDHFFPLLFPKDSESLKILDIRLREVEAKRPLNGTSKVKTHRQTDRQTDRRTNRLVESIGPEGRCFENGTSPRTHIFAVSVG